jgi:hypothetical protein
MNAPLSNPPNLLLSLPLATSLLCSATHAGAQTTASFTVPFAFSANNQDVPARSLQCPASGPLLVSPQPQVDKDRFSAC